MEARLHVNSESMTLNPEGQSAQRKKSVREKVAGVRPEVSGA